MKTIRTETIEPVDVGENSFPIKEKMEQGKMYISRVYSASTHLCLCGCGTECYLPIGNEHWLINDYNGKLTVTPSILQRFECKSHYIITNGVANFV